METVRYIDVTKAQLPIGIEKRNIGSQILQWYPSSKLWVLHQYVENILKLSVCREHSPNDTSDYCTNYENDVYKGQANKQAVKSLLKFFLSQYQNADDVSC